LVHHGTSADTLRQQAHYPITREKSILILSSTSSQSLSEGIDEEHRKFFHKRSMFKAKFVPFDGGSDVDIMLNMAKS